MTSGRIGSAVGGRVIPGTASRLLESAMQVTTALLYSDQSGKIIMILISNIISNYIPFFRIVLHLEVVK